MSEGGDDEPPEGPTSFDLLPDGGFVVSGPRAAYDTALPYLEAMGKGASYVGEGELVLNEKTQVSKAGYKRPVKKKS